MLTLQCPSRLNKGHKQAEELAFCYAPMVGNGIELVGNSLPTFYGAAAPADGQMGRAVRGFTNTATNGDAASAPIPVPVDQLRENSSVYALFQIHTPRNYGRVFSLGSNDGFSWTVNASNQLAIGNATFSIGTDVLSVVAVHTGTTSGIYYVNGVYAGTFTHAYPANITAGSLLYLLNRADRARGALASVYDFRLYNRQLQSAEIADLFVDPWQLFRAPRRLALLPAAGGGPSTVTATAAQSLSLTQAAALVHGVTASVVGTLSLAQTVTAKHGVKATAAQSLALSQSASAAFDQQIRTLSAAQTLTLTQAATGVCGVTATCGQALSFVVSATGVHGVKAYAAQSLSLSQSASLIAPHVGQAVQQLSLSQAVSATFTPEEIQDMLDFGLMLETAAATNILLNCRDWSQTGWTATNVTVSHDDRGLDRVEGSSSTLTAGAAGASIVQTLSAASGAYTGAVDIRRRTGEGAISLRFAGVDTPVTISSLWTRVWVTAVTSAPSFGIVFATSGDAVDVDCGQVEAGDKATSRIITTSAAVERKAESFVIVLASESDILVQDRAGGAWISSVPAGSYTVAPRTGQRSIARLRVFPAGLVSADRKSALGVAYA